MGAREDFYEAPDHPADFSKICDLRGKLHCYPKQQFLWWTT